MRLAVFDTNVIVSAGIQPTGAPAKLIMDWVLAGQVQLVTCPLLSFEYQGVFQRQKFHRYGFPPIWLEFMINESLHLPNPPAWPHAAPDPEDLPLLSLAHSAGAWLVTGNLKHFPREIRQGTSVLSPATYLAHLVESAPHKP